MGDKDQCINQGNADIDEFHEEHHSASISPAEPLCTLDITLNEHEIVQCMNAESPRSRKRLWVQSVLLVLMATYWVVGFITDANHTVSSLVFAFASLLLLAAMWLVPPWEIRRRACLLAEDAIVLHVTVFADHLEFGGNSPQTVSMEDIRPEVCDDLLVLDIGTQTVGIPRRIAGEYNFSLLLELFDLA